MTTTIPPRRWWLAPLLFSLGLNGYWQYVVIGTILIAALGVPYLIGRARANSRPELRRAA